MHPRLLALVRTAAQDLLQPRQALPLSPEREWLGTAAENVHKHTLPSEQGLHSCMENLKCIKQPNPILAFNVNDYFASF